MRVFSTYPWGRPSISTREEHHQYPWGVHALSVRIRSTCEDIQYHWKRSSVPLRHTHIIREDTQYPWGYTEPVRKTSFRQSPSRVLNILMGTDDIHSWARVLIIFLTGTAYPHRYWKSSPWLMNILKSSVNFKWHIWSWVVINVLTLSEARMTKFRAAIQKPLILRCPNFVTFSFYL